MSELVEKVQRAICFKVNHSESGWVHYEHEARAAIAAVAEWLQADGDFYAGIVGIRVERQLTLPAPPEVK